VGASASTRNDFTAPHTAKGKEHQRTRSVFIDSTIDESTLTFAPERRACSRYTLHVAAAQSGVWLIHALLLSSAPTVNGRTDRHVRLPHHQHRPLGQTTARSASRASTTDSTLDQEPFNDAHRSVSVSCCENSVLFLRLSRFSSACAVCRVSFSTFWASNSPPICIFARE